MAATASVGFFLIGLVLCIASFGRTRSFLFWAGFSLPMVSFSLVVGVNLQWFVLLGPLSLALLPVSRSVDLTAIKLRAMWRLIGYITIVTGVWMVLEYTSLQRAGIASKMVKGAGQTTFKMPVQLVSILFQLSAFFIVPMRARTVDDVAASFRGFLAGCFVSGMAGIMLIVVTGSGMTSRSADQAASVWLGDSQLLRLGGFSGEPKTLGAWLGLAAVFLIAFHPSHARAGREKAMRVLLGFFGVILFLTFSTSAWVGMTAGLAFYAALSQFWRRRSRSALAVLAGVVLILIGSQSSFMLKVYQERVESRLFDEDTEEVGASKNSLVWNIYEQQPEKLPVGFGMGGFDLEATSMVLEDPRYWAQLQYERTPTPSTTGLRLLGDLGIIGIGLFVSLALSVSLALRRNGYQDAALFAMAGMVLMMFVSFNVISAYMFLIGGCWSLTRIQPRETARRTDA